MNYKKLKFIIILLFLIMKCNTIYCQKNNIFNTDSTFLVYFDNYFQYLYEKKYSNRNMEKAFVITIDSINKKEEIFNFSIGYIIMDYELPNVVATSYKIYNKQLILFRNKKDFEITHFGNIEKIKYEDWEIINKYIIQRGDIIGVTYSCLYLVVECKNGNCVMNYTFNPDKKYKCQDFFIDSSLYNINFKLNKEQWDSILKK